MIILGKKVLNSFFYRIADKSQVYTQHAYMRPLGVGLFLVLQNFERLPYRYGALLSVNSCSFSYANSCYWPSNWCCSLSCFSDFLWKLLWFWVSMKNLDLDFINVTQLAISLATRYAKEFLLHSNMCFWYIYRWMWTKWKNTV